MNVHVTLKSMRRQVGRDLILSSRYLVPGAQLQGRTRAGERDVFLWGQLSEWLGCLFHAFSGVSEEIIGGNPIFKKFISRTWVVVDLFAIFCPKSALLKKKKKTRHVKLLKAE